MLRKLLYFVIIGFILFSCDKEEVINQKNATRTVLAYILAENSLNDFSKGDINEMMEGMKAVDNADNMIVYVDDNSTPRLIKLEKDKEGKVNQKIIWNYKEQNSVDSNVMEEVFSRTFTTFPADSYGLIFWSHGEGWLPYPTRAPRSFGQDGGENGAMMNIITLAKVINRSLQYIQPVSRFEFIMFDACFMQSVEVMYELRHFADYFIGSPIEIPGPGAPYQYVMKPMFADPCDVQGMTKAYYEYYASIECLNEWGDDRGNSLGVAISLVKSSELEELARKTALLLPIYADKLKDFNPSPVQAFDMRSKKAYYDLGDFMKNLVSADEYLEWISQLQKAVPYAATTDRCFSEFINNTFPMNSYSGISTYIPRSISSYSYWNEYYRKYQWYQDAGWEQAGW